MILKKYNILAEHQWLSKRVKCPVIDKITILAATNTMHHDKKNETHTYTFPA
jgi:hypothetical protein